jgi:hypothetical protein
MRQLYQEIPVSFEKKVSGAADLVIEEIDLGDIGGVSSGAVFNIALQFPSDFDDVSRMNGLYEPRFWIQNLPAFAGTKFEFELNTNPVTDLSSPSNVPRVDQENENITKATYYDDTDEELGIISLRVNSTSAPSAIYDTVEQDRSDPGLIIEWERQTAGQLDADVPTPNSDHIWEFSQVDLFVNVSISDAGTTTDQKWLVGWIADEDFTADLRQETVDFRKGKPTAKAVVFMSEIVAMIGGQIASCDPWIVTEGLHISAKTENRRLKWEETNKQRPISIRNYSLEWSTNSGHYVKVDVPRGQFFFTGEKTPGAGEIAKQAFEIHPLVNPLTNKVYTMSITKSPVQRAAIPIIFSVTPT